MIKKITIFVICILISGLSLSAEEADTVRSNSLGITLSYTSETLTHPGVYAGIEYIPFQNNRNKFILSANLGFTVHPRNNFSLYALVETGYRFVGKRGFMFDFFAGAGYKHAWLSSYPETVIYEADSEGNIVKAVNWGNPYLLLSQMIGVGWDFSVRTRLPMLLFLRTGVTEEYPYNNLFVPRIILSLGVTYYLK